MFRIAMDVIFKNYFLVVNILKLLKILKYINLIFLKDNILSKDTRRHII
jgi:hypothetical protein